MEKFLFQDATSEQRLQLLKDNSDELIEDYGYDKPLSKEQLKSIKDELSSASIALADVQAEKKEVDKGYNDQIKDFKETIAEKVKQLKNRTTYTCELCFKMLDRESAQVGIYNKDGLLVEQRPATMKELREPDNMFKGVSTAKTGTNG